nr:gliding motility-associated C-terminal domain-containing protein [Saprospiraceae bacterium]
EGRAIIWTCLPQPDAGVDEESCGLNYQLEASPMDDAGFWEAIPSNGVVFADPSSAYTAVEVPGFGEYCFTWTAVDGACSGSSTVCITFLDSPEMVPGSLEIECDSTATFYTVSFAIQHGDIATYQVDGGGELDGSFFTSSLIPAGDSYVFSISDQYMCEIFEVSGQGDCDCISQAGELSGMEQHLCVDESVNPGEFNYDSTGEQLDGDDIRVFILTTDPNPGESDLIDQNFDGEFSFDSQLGMTTGETYWILVAVGDEIPAGNIDFNDPCLSFSQAIPVVWYDHPEIGIPDMDYEITCDQPILSIEVNPFENHYSYTWTTTNGEIVAGTENQRIVEVQSAGTYTVTVRDLISGCETTTSVDVLLSDDLPEVHILMPDTLNCILESVILDGSNSSSGSSFSFNWEGPGIANGDSALIVSVNVPGEYTLTIVNDDTACSVSASVIVYEDREDPEAIAFVEDELNCSNETVILFGHGSTEGPGIVYQWAALDSTAHILSGHQNLVAMVNSAGLYQLVVTNSINGCSDEAIVQVTENVDLITDLEVSSGGIICPGDSDGFIFIESVEGGTPPYRYSFDSGNSFGGNPMTTSLNPGTYFIVVEDAVGCVFETEIILPDPPPFAVDLGPDLVVEPGTSVLLEALVNKNEDSIVSWIWEPLLDPDCEHCPSQQFTPDQSMNISVVVVDRDGCMARDEIYMRLFGQNNVYIPNAFSPDNDGINDLFGIFSEVGSISIINEFRIFDRWGEQVFSRSYIEPSTELNSNNAWNGTFNGENMSSGVYVYYFNILFEDGAEEVFQGEVTLIR